MWHVCVCVWVCVCEVGGVGMCVGVTKLTLVGGITVGVKSAKQ